MGTDKKFLGGAGVGFLGGAIAGAGITHIVHKKKQKKEEEEEKQRKKQEKKDKKKKKRKARQGSSSSFSSYSSCSSSSDSDSNCGRYSVGTKVWTNWAGWEYRGTIVRVTRYNTYHIVWEDGDESEWSERKVRRSRMKRGLE